jgi:hypothetical protein
VQGEDGVAVLYVLAGCRSLWAEGRACGGQLQGSCFPASAASYTLPPSPPMLPLILYCALLCYAVLRCAVPCCAVLCRAVPSRAVLCRAVSCHAVLCRAVPCHAVLCTAVPRRAVSCCAVPRRAVSCCAAPCCIVLCRAAPCCAVLLDVVIRCAVLYCACTVLRCAALFTGHSRDLHNVCAPAVRAPWSPMLLCSDLSL